MADEFNNQANYQNPNPAPTSTMNPNLKGTLISGIVYTAGLALCPIPYINILGGLAVLGGLIALIIFMVKYFQDIANEPNTGCINSGMHIALTLLTSGIWGIYWYYRTTKYLRENIPGYIKEPQTETLLCALVPYYQVYWAYKTGEIIEGISLSKGVQKDVKVVALLLGLFTYWWGPVIYLQLMMNEIIGAPEFGQPIFGQSNANYQPAGAQTNYQAAPQPTYQAPAAQAVPTYTAPAAQPTYQAAATGAQTNYQAAPQPTPQVPGYRPMLEHVLLTLFTFGIYAIIWIYKTTEYLRQNVPGYTKDPMVETLLCLFVPYYEIYWTYKTAEAIEMMATQRGTHKDIKTVGLLLAIFTYFAGPAIYLQMMINDVLTFNPAAAPQYAAPAAQPAYQAPVAPSYQYQTSTAVDNSEALKKYKELLDAGIITQEEFDAKKSEILGN